jgi:hypothetical protein
MLQDAMNPSRSLPRLITKSFYIRDANRIDGCNLLDGGCAKSSLAGRLQGFLAYMH